MNNSQHQEAMRILSQLRSTQATIERLVQKLPHPDPTAWIGIDSKLEDVITDVCRAIAENRG